MLQFCIYPQYSVKPQLSKSLPQRNGRSIRDSTLKTLREALSKNESVQTAYKYIFYEPTN